MNELISGQFPWDRNEIVTVIGADPDGDRFMARDRRGNQQLIPRTYLKLLPSLVRSLLTPAAATADPPEQRCLCSGPAPLLAFHQ